MRFGKNLVNWFRFPAMDGHSPRVFTGDLGIRFRTRCGTTPSCKNIKLTGK